MMPNRLLLLVLKRSILKTSSTNVMFFDKNNVKDAWKYVTDTLFETDISFVHKCNINDTKN